MLIFLPTVKTITLFAKKKTFFMLQRIILLQLHLIS